MLTIREKSAFLTYLNKIILVWDLTFTKAKLKWLIAMLFDWDFAF